MGVIVIAIRAKSELIIVYMQSDEHDLAHDLAKGVYNRIPNNPLNANNYLSCLFHRNKNEVSRELVEEILEKLKSNPSERSQEMYCSAQVKIYAKYDNNIELAYKVAYSHDFDHRFSSALIT